MHSVLLVEGHLMMRTALRDLLAANGFYGVVEANDPIEAIVKTNSLSPRIIVLDTNWQEMRGLYLSKILRELSPQSRIVLLVDEKMNGAPEIQESSGADACIAKNALIEELPELITQWNHGAPIESIRIGS